MKNLRYALSYLMKFRGGNPTRLISLVLGLAISLLIFSYVHYTLTFDRFFPDRDRIYQIWETGKFGISSSMVAPLAPALADEMPAVETATRFRPSSPYDLYYNDEPYPSHVKAVDTCFFDVLDFGVVRGNPKELVGTNTVMLSETLARTIFGKRDPMGEQVFLASGTPMTPMTVVGVFRDVPRNNSVDNLFDALVPFEWLNAYKGWEGGDSFASYIKLHEGASIAEVEAMLTDFYERHGQTEFREQWEMQTLFVPIADASRTDSPVVQIAWILSGLAVLILFVATMNYVLVSISSLVSRAKTVAMLRCHGARRWDVAAIFLWETVLLVAAATAVAAFVLWALQDQIRQLCDVPVGELFAPARIWVPAAVLLTTLLAAGALPAGAFASVPLTTAFRGRTAGRRGWRRALLFIEIAGVTLALGVLSVFSLQLHHLRRGEMGFNVDRTVAVLPIGTRAQFRNMVEAYTAMPEVEEAGSILWTLPIWGYSGQPCFDETTNELLFSCRLDFADEYYVDAVGMKMAAGRSFTATSAEDEALVNETYCRLRGWEPEEAVGKRISSSPAGDWSHTVVGVVKDFRTVVTSGEVQPIVIGNIDEMMSYAERKYRGRIIIRLREWTPEALEAVRAKAREFESGNNYNLDILPELRDQLFETEIRVYRIASIVALVVLLISIAGLVGYLGDEIRRRSREIAIRKVNGATEGSILRLLARDMAVMSAPALAVGCAAAYAASARALELFVSRIPLRWWIFAAVLGFIAAVMAVILLLRTRRIVRENPVKTIKTE